MAQVHEFKMEMTCEGCANAAKKVLGKKGDKVKEVVTSVADQKVLVTSDLDSKELLEALQNTGKTVTYVGVKN